MAAIAEEQEAVAGFYDDAFEVCDEAWRITLRESSVAVTLIFRLPKGYPNEAPPSLAFEFEPWPARGDALAERLRGEVAELWLPGEGCVIGWAEHVRQTLLDGPPELAGAAAGAAAVPGPAAAAAAGGAAADEDCGAGRAVASVACPAALAQPLGVALVAAGFKRFSDQLFSHSTRGVTVEIGDELTITVDGIDAEDLSDRAALQLETEIERFGALLLEWVDAQRSPDPGFVEGEVDAGGGCDFLPTPEELGVDRARALLVYTWGKALRKAAPADSQCNFNAGILNGRGGGADLRTMNGLSEEVQNNVKCCTLFPRWISMVCHKVEHSGLNTISINCTKGRHRSVAAAMILKETYYPQATVVHLTIH